MNPEKQQSMPSKTPWGRVIDDKLATTYQHVAEKARGLGRALVGPDKEERLSKAERHLLRRIREDVRALETPWRVSVFDAIRISERLAIGGVLGLITPPEGHPDPDPTGSLRGWAKCEEEEGLMKPDGTIEWVEKTAWDVLWCKLNMM